MSAATVTTTLSKLTPQELAFLIDTQFPALSIQYDPDACRYLAPSNSRQGASHPIRCLREDGVIRHACDCQGAVHGHLCRHLHLFSRQIGPLDQVAAGEEVYEIDRAAFDARYPGLFRTDYSGRRVA